MKRVLSLLLVALLLCGCNPATPVQPADTTEDSTAADMPTDTTGAPETEPPMEEDLAYTQPITVEYDNYTVTLEAPVLVGRGKVGDDAWGHNQFPNLRFTKEGYLFASWTYGDDVVGAAAPVAFMKISLNGGKNWVPNGSTGYGPRKTDIQMANGKYFGGFVNAGTVKVPALHDTYEAGAAWGNGHKLFFAEDFAEDPLAIENKLVSLSFYEYDAETGENTVVPCTLNWPNAPLHLYGGHLFYTVSGYFALSGGNVIATSDGKLITCIYCTGFDSEAETREDAIAGMPANAKSAVYVFESPDSGRTWNYLAQHIPGEEVEDLNAPGFEGYDEPKMIEMPDGSLLMLMRSGGTSTAYCPLYVTRSSDGGHTWTTPEVFDYCGVLPQLCKLENGVTLATYGRPDLLLRTTDDPSGAVWNEHIDIPLSSDSTNWMTKSCFYTKMLPLSENTAIMIYSDFKYPDKNGDPVKTILTRRITVTLKEES